MAGMTWIFAAVGLAVAGLAVLAVLTARVFAAARDLGQEVDRTRKRLNQTGDEHPVRIGAFRDRDG